MSIVLWTENWKPDSFYDKIASNRKRGLHTLCLLGKSPPFNGSSNRSKLKSKEQFFLSETFEGGRGADHLSSYGNFECVQHVSQ